MKLACTINGQPAEIEIEGVNFSRGALTTTEAAVYLGCSERTVHTLTKLGKLTRTSYGNYPLESIRAHLVAEMKGKK